VNEDETNDTINDISMTTTTSTNLLSIACATVADETLSSVRSAELASISNGGDGDTSSERRTATTLTFNPFRDDDDGWMSRQTVCCVSFLQIYGTCQF
jgi:hypothetical protein